MSSSFTDPLPARRWPVAGAWVAALVVGAVQLWGGLHRRTADRLPDLQVYLGSVDKFWDGGSLYDFAAVGTGAPFTYPPFAGLIFSPLAFVPFPAVATVWTVATFAAVVGVAFVAVRRSELRGGPLLTALVTVALLASGPISSNVRFGQISIFLVAAVLVDALTVVPERYRGIATGIAGAIKLTPLVFVPYYWFSGQRRAAVTSAVSFAVCTLLAWAVLPGESVRFWFTEVWHVNRLGHIATGGNQSLNGVLLRWDLPDSARTVIAGVLGSAIVGLALWRAVRAYRNARPLAAAVLVGAAGLVFSPVSWTHHQVWLVLAALVAVSARPRLNLVWAAIVLAVMILPLAALADGLSDHVVTGNARLWLAVAVAAAVPFVAVRRERTGAVVPMPRGTVAAAAPAEGGSRPSAH